MKQKKSRHRYLISVFIIGTALMAGCGGGSSDSGGGFTTAPGGTIPEDTPTTITQSGTYVLPSVAYLTDIRIECPGANVDATANNANTGRTFAAICNGGFASIIDFPSGGGNLVVDFNSGNPITVKVQKAASLGINNR